MRGLRGGKTDECRGDLIARERRGELSGNDCLALRAHVAECDSCRLARQVFVDLDDVSGVDLHDGLRIEKMSMAARRWGQQATRARVRPVRRAWAARGPVRAMAFAAVVLLIGGTASATMWWFRHPAAVAPVIERFETLGSSESGQRSGKRARRKADTTPAQAAPTIAVAPEVAAVGPPEVASLPTVPTVGAEDPAPQAPVQTSAVARSRHRQDRRVALNASARDRGDDRASSPSALLRQASGARRAGDADHAVALYRKLQRDFPHSPEATLSAVSLGGLLLDRRLPRAALTQFDGYLLASGGGVLIPEALYGRGRALATLGDRQEERRTWDRLLTDFPESTYGAFAKRRLHELE